MTAVTVRFTSSASELGRIRAKLSGARPGLSLALAIVLAVVFVAQGIMNIGFRHGGAFFVIGICQLVLGLCYVPINIYGRLTTLLLCKAETETHITIDDFGLTIASPPLRVPWKNVSGIRDVGEAYIVMRATGRSIPILKRALPDGGTALWAALDAKLTSKRYLVRGTDSRLMIANWAARK